MKKEDFKIIPVILLNIVLTVFGIRWGLPYRWNLDERITTPIRMVVEKTYFYCSVDVYHPLFYKYFLMMFLGPYYLFLKVSGYNFAIAKKAASMSWLSLGNVAPDFVNGLMITGRLSSALLAAFTVLMVYAITKKIYNSKCGIFAALALTLNVGFVGTSHFIKNENLALFLFVCVLYLWILILMEKMTYKRLYLAGFLTGLAIGTKLDSLILVFGTLIMILFIFKDQILSLGKKLKIIIVVPFFIFCGLLFGYPRIIFPIPLKVGIIEGASRGFSVLFSLPTVASIMEQTKITVLNIASSFGIVLSFFVVAGLAGLIIRYKKIKRAESLLLLVLAAYLAVNFFIYNSVSTKLIFFSLPILAIFAGYSFGQLWNKLNNKRLAKVLVSVFVLAFSLCYIIKADLVFAKYDTRYISTEWIEDNVKPGASIFIAQEPEVLFKSNLISDYKIYYRGMELRFDNNPYRETINISEDNYKSLLATRSYDYIVVSSWDFVRYETGAKDRMLEKMSDIKGYCLIKSIYYNEDLLFNPRPPYTSPAVFIFKKVSR